MENVLKFVRIRRHIYEKIHDTALVKLCAMISCSFNLGIDYDVMKTSTPFGIDNGVDNNGVDNGVEKIWNVSCKFKLYI